MRTPMPPARFSVGYLLVALAAAPAALAQATAGDHVHDASHDHALMLSGASTAAEPLPAGQAAFEAIASVVAALDADPATDWSKVDVEALRRHLVDMDLVIMRSSVTASDVTGGVRFRVDGDDAVAAAIRRMTMAHARALDAMPEFEAAASETADGAILEVRAANGDTATTARIRGLGYAGLLTLGSHHGPHHLMIARGQVPPGH